MKYGIKKSQEILKNYEEEFGLLKTYEYEKGITHIFDYFGYYLYIYCDKNGRIINDLIAEYY